MAVQCKVIEPQSEIDKILYKYCVSVFRQGYVEVGDTNIIMPIYYKKIANDIENFEVRDSDVWIITYPKTGTTWSQEMMWLILNNLDYDGANVSIDERFVYLELQSIFDFEGVKKKFPHFTALHDVSESVTRAKNNKRIPRLIKTHLPWCLLPKAIRDNSSTPKIVYVARNPKDTCVSFFHHQRLIEGYTGNFEDFCKLFLAGRLNYGPYWNIMDFWKRRHQPNILFLKYENMKRDLPSVIKTASDFLIGKQFSGEEINRLAEHLSFENMKKNPNVNYEETVKFNQLFMKSVDENGKFMRSGTTGNYKTEMTPEIIEKFDEWIDKHTKGSDIAF